MSAEPLVKDTTSLREVLQLNTACDNSNYAAETNGHSYVKTLDVAATNYDKKKVINHCV
jgi:hypothetical protein